MANENREPSDALSDALSDADAAPRRTTIVGVGASAGGVKALLRFFEALPAEVGAAFVVIVHLDPNAHSELPEILAARCKLPVKQVTKKSALKPDCVYVIGPDRQLQITDDEISAVPFKEPRGRRAPIDLFFRSLAEQHGDGFAVILTGAGSDGAIGVTAIKESGGIILVQDPEEAEYPSMPRAAIATGAADFVMPVAELAVHLVELVKTKRQVVATAPRDGDEEEILRRILAHLRVRTGHDFSNYKRSTVMRRILRRMQVARRETLEEYFADLRDGPEEARALFADLLISVTTFFRDSKSFDALAKQVIPRLFAAKDATNPLRVWVVGCATGEEAYSIAILLLEEAARHELRPEIQIFATDMDSRALTVARDGRYPSAIEADVGEDRLRRFFQHEGEHYRVKRELRDLVLFANHSLLRDPPFSHLDLVSCRNLLIYLNRELQQQVITAVHYGLNPEGYLFLGSSETADHTDHLFRAVDRESRIYQSAAASRDKPPHLPRLLGMTRMGERTAADQTPTLPSPRGSRFLHREALETMAPPSVLVDSSNRVLHLSENAGRYLLPPGGTFTADIIELVREEMKHELRSALHHALERHLTVLTPPMLVKFNGSAHRVYVQVKPIKGADGHDSKRALCLFVESEADEQAETQEGLSGQAKGDTVNRLRQELDLANSHLRTLREESEASNEELRAANEELQSINEEYRSTAEELETSKEELQSINEELQTVNSELKQKLDTVSRANSDLQNLMAATDLGTLFLDPGLHIKRFTPRTTDLFNITATDVGRSITDFTHQLEYEQLATDARKVLRDLTPVQREVHSRNDGWYLVRIRPYRTMDDKIDGVVMTFVDVTQRHQMEEALRSSEEHLRQEMRLVEVSRAPIFVWDFDSGIRQWNRGSEELYGYSKEEALGKTKVALLKTVVPGSSFEALKKDLLDHGTWKGELGQITKSGKHLTVESQIELLTVGGSRFVLESTRDITESKALEARLRLLLGELTHRVKNILAVVQGMVHQTWRSTGDKHDFIERLDGRLAALAGSHKLLVESDWKGAEIRKLVENELAAFVGDAPRVRMKGAAVTLSPDIATPFALVIHELATNAVKYGALSTEKGIVEVDWSTSRGNKGMRLKFNWREKDGPSVKKPTQSGFGSKLIQQGMPGAEVKYEFRREGVECSIDVPLPQPSQGL